MDGPTIRHGVWDDALLNKGLNGRLQIVVSYAALSALTEVPEATDRRGAVIPDR